MIELILVADVSLNVQKALAAMGHVVVRQEDSYVELSQDDICPSWAAMDGEELKLVVDNFCTGYIQPVVNR